jgi:hypothetical protein
VALKTDEKLKRVYQHNLKDLSADVHPQKVALRNEFNAGSGTAIKSSNFLMMA